MSNITTAAPKGNFLTQKHACPVLDGLREKARIAARSELRAQARFDAGYGTNRELRVLEAVEDCSERAFQTYLTAYNNNHA